MEDHSTFHSLVANHFKALRSWCGTGQIGQSKLFHFQAILIFERIWSAALTKSKATHYVSFRVRLMLITRIAGGLITYKHKERITLFD